VLMCIGTWWTWSRTPTCICPCLWSTRYLVLICSINLIDVAFSKFKNEW
jgi:hypothetical protein